jgi:CheY-like chemotaxis protein
MDLKEYYENALFLEDGFQDIIQSSEDFYNLTLKRDEAFIDNMLEKMEHQSASAPGTSQNKDLGLTGAPVTGALVHGVLITGGYHTPNLKKLLKERNISYVVLTPTITHETNQKRYEKILLNQPSSAQLSEPFLSVAPKNSFSSTIAVQPFLSSYAGFRTLASELVESSQIPFARRQWRARGETGARLSSEEAPKVFDAFLAMLEELQSAKQDGAKREKILKNFKTLPRGNEFLRPHMVTLVNRKKKVAVLQRGLQTVELVFKKYTFVEPYEKRIFEKGLYFWKHVFEFSNRYEQAILNSENGVPLSKRGLPDVGYWNNYINNKTFGGRLGQMADGHQAGRLRAFLWLVALTVGGWAAYCGGLEILKARRLEERRRVEESQRIESGLALVRHLGRLEQKRIEVFAEIQKKQKRLQRIQRLMKRLRSRFEMDKKMLNEQLDFLKDKVGQLEIKNDFSELEETAGKIELQQRKINETELSYQAPLQEMIDAIQGLENQIKILKKQQFKLEDEMNQFQKQLVKSEEGGARLSKIQSSKKAADRLLKIERKIQRDPLSAEEMLTEFFKDFPKKFGPEFISDIILEVFNHYAKESSDEQKGLEHLQSFFDKITDAFNENIFQNGLKEHYEFLLFFLMNAYQSILAYHTRKVPKQKVIEQITFLKNRQDALNQKSRSIRGSRLGQLEKLFDGIVAKAANADIGGMTIHKRNNHDYGSIVLKTQTRQEIQHLRISLRDGIIGISVETKRGEKTNSDSISFASDKVLFSSGEKKFFEYQNRGYLKGIAVEEEGDVYVVVDQKLWDVYKKKFQKFTGLPFEYASVMLVAENEAKSKRLRNLVTVGARLAREDKTPRLRAFLWLVALTVGGWVACYGGLWAAKVIRLERQLARQHHGSGARLADSKRKIGDQSVSEIAKKLNLRDGSSRILEKIYFESPEEYGWDANNYVLKYLFDEDKDRIFFLERYLSGRPELLSDSDQIRLTPIGKGMNRFTYSVIFENTDSKQREFLPYIKVSKSPLLDSIPGVNTASMFLEWVNYEILKTYYAPNEPFPFSKIYDARVLKQRWVGAGEAVSGNDFQVIQNKWIRKIELGQKLSEDEFYRLQQIIYETGRMEGDIYARTGALWGDLKPDNIGVEDVLSVKDGFFVKNIDYEQLMVLDDNRPKLLKKYSQFYNDTIPINFEGIRGFDEDQYIGQFAESIYRLFFSTFSKVLRSVRLTPADVGTIFLAGFLRQLLAKKQSVDAGLIQKELVNVFNFMIDENHLESFKKFFVKYDQNVLARTLLFSADDLKALSLGMWFAVGLSPQKVHELEWLTRVIKNQGARLAAKKGGESSLGGGSFWVGDFSFKIKLENGRPALESSIASLLISDAYAFKQDSGYFWKILNDKEWLGIILKDAKSSQWLLAVRDKNGMRIGEREFKKGSHIDLKEDRGYLVPTFSGARLTSFDGHQVLAKGLNVAAHRGNGRFDQTQILFDLVEVFADFGSLLRLVETKSLKLAPSPNEAQSIGSFQGEDLLRAQKSQDVPVFFAVLPSQDSFLSEKDHRQLKRRRGPPEESGIPIQGAPRRIWRIPSNRLNSFQKISHPSFLHLLEIAFKIAFPMTSKISLSEIQSLTKSLQEKGSFVNLSGRGDQVSVSKTVGRVIADNSSPLPIDKRLDLNAEAKNLSADSPMLMSSTDIPGQQSQKRSFSRWHGETITKSSKEVNNINLSKNQIFIQAFCQQSLGQFSGFVEAKEQNGYLVPTLSGARLAEMNMDKALKIFERQWKAQESFYYFYTKPGIELLEKDDGKKEFSVSLEEERIKIIFSEKEGWRIELLGRGGQTRYGLQWDKMGQSFSILSEGSSYWSELKTSNEFTGAWEAVKVPEDPVVGIVLEKGGVGKNWNLTVYVEPHVYDRLDNSSISGGSNEDCLTLRIWSLPGARLAGKKVLVADDREDDRAVIKLDEKVISPYAEKFTSKEGARLSGRIIYADMKNKFKPTESPVVIVVEDDAFVAARYERFISKEFPDYDIVFTSYLNHAKEAIETAHASKLLKLVLTDNNFPEDETNRRSKPFGKEVVKLVKSKNIPTLMISSDSRPSGLPEELPDSYLTKDASTDKIILEMRRLIESSRNTSGSPIESKKPDETGSDQGARLAGNTEEKNLQPPIKSWSEFLKKYPTLARIEALDKDSQFYRNELSLENFLAMLSSGNYGFGVDNLIEILRLFEKGQREFEKFFNQERKSENQFVFNLSLKEKLSKSSFMDLIFWVQNSKENLIQFSISPGDADFLKLVSSYMDLVVWYYLVLCLLFEKMDYRSLRKAALEKVREECECRGAYESISYRTTNGLKLLELPFYLKKSILIPNFSKIQFKPTLETIRTFPPDNKKDTQNIFKIDLVLALQYLVTERVSFLVMQALGEDQLKRYKEFYNLKIQIPLRGQADWMHLREGPIQLIARNVVYEQINNETKETSWWQEERWQKLTEWQMKPYWENLNTSLISGLKESFQNFYTSIKPNESFDQAIKMVQSTQSEFKNNFPEVELRSLLEVKNPSDASKDAVKSAAETTNLISQKTEHLKENPEHSLRIEVSDKKNLGAHTPKPKGPRKAKKALKSGVRVRSNATGEYGTVVEVVKNIVSIQFDSGSIVKEYRSEARKKVEILGARLTSETAFFVGASSQLLEGARKALAVGERAGRLRVFRLLKDGNILLVEGLSDKIVEINLKETGAQIRQVEKDFYASDKLKEDSRLMDWLIGLSQAKPLTLPAPLLDRPEVYVIHLNAFESKGERFAKEALSNLLTQLDKRMDDNDLAVLEGTDDQQKRALRLPWDLGLGRRGQFAGEVPEERQKDPTIHLGAAGDIGEVAARYPAHHRWVGLAEASGANQAPVFNFPVIVDLLKLILISDGDCRKAFEFFRARYPKYKNMTYAEFELLIQGDPVLARRYPIIADFEIDLREALHAYALSRAILSNA